MSEFMAGALELKQPPQNKGTYVFETMEYFDLKFENNTFSEHDYKQIVENCIGKSINDFRPDVCVKDYDLNCLYCELMPLIKEEIHSRILTPGDNVGFFYLYFGYNSTALDNNSMGYGLCYGTPIFVPSDSDALHSDQRCFCDDKPRTDKPTSDF